MLFLIRTEPVTKQFLSIQPLKFFRIQVRFPHRINPAYSSNCAAVQICDCHVCLHFLCLLHVWLPVWHRLTSPRRVMMLTMAASVWLHNDRGGQITKSARYHCLSPHFFWFSRNFQPWVSITVSAGVQTPWPALLRAGFFWFPFVPSFSHLPPQLSLCGQRSTALSQVHAGTAAVGFMNRLN